MNPPSPSDPGTGPYAPAAALDRVIAGRYRLLQQLGEGGFGVVYLAEQRDPVQRTVAVKVIKPGMDSAQIIARFEQERQALALMDHPHIAKVLDGGTTDEGRPFFVMELVRGIPITKYCDEQRLTPWQRLELFMAVCQAVQHAHQKGIIHRDLKPSNVLVTLQDGKPVPKVIDFGVAKAVHQRLTERTMFTEIGALIGTPEYMSPEQAGVNPLDIDTRSDIYSLGVLLYELLTGVTPLDHKRLRQSAHDEVLRLIRETEPAKPSTRISTIEGLPAVAARRQVEPKKLRQLLRGDLDWVVMKALEKDRNRRYETANGFALDIQRHLTDEPVLAGPPSAGYRLRKFLKRNRRAVVAAAVALALLVVGIVGTSIGLVRALAAERRAEYERARADANFQQAQQAIDQFYTRFSTGLADQPGAHKVRRELLETALKFYEGFLDNHGGDAGLRADVAMTYWRIARIRQDLGDARQAMADLRKAIAIQEALAAEHPATLRYREDLASSCTSLSLLVARHGDRPEAIRLMERAIELREQVARESPDDLALRGKLGGVWNDMGVLLDELGHVKRSLEAHQKSLDIRADLARRKPDEFTYQSELSQCHNNLGAWYFRARDDATSRHHYEQGLAIRERLHKRAPESVGIRMELARSHHNLALLHNRAGRPADALRHNQAARDVCDELARDHPAVPEYRKHLADAYRGMGISYHAQNQMSQAHDAMKRCYDVRVALVDTYPTETTYLRDLAQAASNLGAICQMRGRFADALVPAERAATVYAALLKSAPNDADLRTSYAQACTNLGAIRTETDQPAAALEPLDAALATYREMLRKEPDSAKVLDESAGAWSNRALALQKLERWDDAMTALGESVTNLKRLLARDPKSAPVRANLADNYIAMAQIHLRLRRPGPAAELALACQTLWPNHRTRLYNVGCVLARCVPLVTEGAERSRHADAAMAALRQAIAAGYKDAAHMEKDADLAALRERDDFKKLLAELRAKAGARPRP